MTWLHLFLVLCALHGVWADEVVSDVFPKGSFALLYHSKQTHAVVYPIVCAFLPNTRLVGEDIHERPILRLPSPSACCDACLNYKGEEGCVAYTFFFRNGVSECWLKRDAVVAEFSEEGDSGFPNFYHNDAYPDLSSDLGESLAMPLISLLVRSVSRCSLFWVLGSLSSPFPFLPATRDERMEI